MHRLPLPHVSRLAFVTAVLLAPTAGITRGRAQSAPRCEDDPTFQMLDFWVGEWNVFVGEQQVGTNRIEKVLSGCAVIEHWRDAAGGEGKSLFYYHAAAGAWKQVWVTENPLVPGGVKEKQLIATLEGGAIRFQGTISLPNGGSYLDRTTLTPLDDARVRQVIEINRDGQTWEVGFDAIYVRRQAG
jgi:hypothetical protein